MVLLVQSKLRLGIRQLPREIVCPRALSLCLCLLRGRSKRLLGRLVLCSLDGYFRGVHLRLHLQRGLLRDSSLSLQFLDSSRACAVRCCCSLLLGCLRL